MTALLADIGATHARFALTDLGYGPIAADILLAAGHDTFEEALKAFLNSKRVEPRDVQVAVIAAAGPVRRDGSIHMTNGPWVLDPAAISAATGIEQVCVLNDMSAAALGLPDLAEADMEKIGSGNPLAVSPKAILAPGTGLGISALVPCAEGHGTALSGEGGHVDLAPHNERELAVVFHLLRQFGHASPERVLSGPGLATLYAALGALDGVEGASIGGADIAAAAKRGEAQAIETIQLFCGWLGSVAGDLALTLGARGGVYVAGGIVPQWGGLFDRERFRRRFEAKGRLDKMLADIPTYLVMRQDLGLLGCRAEARRLLG